MTPEKGSIVTIECSLQPEGEFVPEPLFDAILTDVTSDRHEILKFVLGEGNYLPGLHDVVSTMNEGDLVKVSVDAGWGAWNPNLQARMSFDSLSGSGLDTSLIKEGVELVMENGMTAVVTEVSEKEFVVDANPPLAGASYLAQVKLLSIETGPTDLEYSPRAGENSRYQVATFALGCFWGAELAFMRQPGVVGTKGISIRFVRYHFLSALLNTPHELFIELVVGYTQGSTENPSYEEVCSGSTGHAEAVMVIYDPLVASYEQLIRLAMDRLGENRYLLNQVGNDKGTQYRHGVYYHNDKQKRIAEEIVGSFGEDCMTEILPAKKFYAAEDYHQQYLLKGGQSARKGDRSTIRCYG